MQNLEKTEKNMPTERHDQAVIRLHREIVEKAQAAVRLVNEEKLTLTTARVVDGNFYFPTDSGDWFVVHKGSLYWVRQLGETPTETVKFYLSDPIAAGWDVEQLQPIADSFDVLLKSAQA